MLCSSWHDMAKKVSRVNQNDDLGCGMWDVSVTVTVTVKT